MWVHGGGHWASCIASIRALAACPLSRIGSGPRPMSFHSHRSCHSHSMGTAFLARALPENLLGCCIVMMATPFWQGPPVTAETMVLTKTPGWAIPERRERPILGWHAIPQCQINRFHLRKPEDQPFDSLSQTGCDSLDTLQRTWTS